MRARVFTGTHGFIRNTMEHSCEIDARKESSEALQEENKAKVRLNDREHARRRTCRRQELVHQRQVCQL